MSLHSGRRPPMRIGPKHPCVAGDTLPVTPAFEHAGPERVELAIEPMGVVPSAMGR